jgi:hypothetical protein
MMENLTESHPGIEPVPTMHSDPAMTRRGKNTMMRAPPVIEVEKEI